MFRKNVVFLSFAFFVVFFGSQVNAAKYQRLYESEDPQDTSCATEDSAFDSDEMFCNAIFCLIEAFRRENDLESLEDYKAISKRITGLAKKFRREISPCIIEKLGVIYKGNLLFRRKENESIRIVPFVAGAIINMVVRYRVEMHKHDRSICQFCCHDSEFVCKAISVAFAETNVTLDQNVIDIVNNYIRGLGIEFCLNEERKVFFKATTTEKILFFDKLLFG